jgi:hypothetical protein
LEAKRRNPQVAARIKPISLAERKRLTKSVLEMPGKAQPSSLRSVATIVAENREIADR